jgi:hypothetical protein
MGAHVSPAWFGSVVDCGMTEGMTGADPSTALIGSCLVALGAASPGQVMTEPLGPTACSRHIRFHST